MFLNMACPWVFLYLAYDSVYAWGRGPTNDVLRSIQIHCLLQIMSNATFLALLMSITPWRSQTVELCKRKGIWREKPAEAAP